MVNQQIEKFEQENPFRNNASLRLARADHACLGVDDFGTAARWYVEKLGFQLEGQWTIAQAPGMTVGFLVGPGGFGLELIAGGKGARNPVGSKWMEHLMLRGWNHLSFWSEDVDATMAELARRQVPAFLPPTEFSEGAAIRLAFVQDPEGNVIQFTGPPAGKQEPKEKS